MTKKKISSRSDMEMDYLNQPDHTDFYNAMMDSKGNPQKKKDSKNNK